MKRHHDTISQEYSGHTEYCARRWRRYSAQTLRETFEAITLTETEEPPRLFDIACGTGIASANGFQIQTQKIFNVGMQWGLTAFTATKQANRFIVSR